MNSYSIGITGSWLTVIISILVAIIVSFFYYRRTVPALSPIRRYFLFTLRALALSLLLFVIFEPVFTSITGKTEEPEIALLLDKSISMKIKDATIDRKEIYKSVLNKLNLDAGKIKTKSIAFDNSFESLSRPVFDSLHIDGQSTNITNALQWVASNTKDRNIAAVLLISDGAFNEGENPLYSAEKLAKPIYTVGIGDTNEPKDISVHSIITNQIAHINTTVPVNVNIQASGYEDTQLKVTLLENSKPIAEQIINIQNANENTTLTFDYNAKKSGIWKLTAKAAPQKDEITLKNNAASEFIEVTSNKRNIMILAGSPSPDVSFIINTLEQDKGVQINKFIQKDKASFYNRPPNKTDFAKCDIIFMLAFPNAFTPDNIIAMLNTALQAGKPLFLIASRDLSYSKLKRIEQYLPFTILASNKKEYSAVAKFDEQVLNNPLLRIQSNSNSIEEWNKLPPLFRTETFVKPKPQAKMLAKVKVNSIVLNEPMIISSTNLQQRTVAILAYGIYRWKLLGFAQDQYHNPNDATDLFTAFIANSQSWLTSSLNKKNVIIKPVRKIFRTNEKAEFTAQVYDAAFNPLDNANVNVQIKGNNNSYELTLYPIGNGQYKGYIENLPNGDYYYSGRATINGTILGNVQGRFGIGDIPTEYQNLMLNKSLLNEISVRTGGKFYHNDNVEQLLSDIQNNANFKQRTLTIKSELALWHLPFILGVVIFLFAIEWFFRKRFGLL